VTSTSGLPEENTTNFAYDPTSCNLVGTMDPLGHTTVWAYDVAGNVIRSTDAEGRVTRFEYDAMNRLTKVIDVTNVDTDPPCGIAGVTCYEYDLRGNLTRVTDARGSVTPFEYDALDRLTATIDPLGRRETFTYDGNGNLATTVTRKGEMLTFEYDALNRLVLKLLPGNLQTFFDYDLAGNLRFVGAPGTTIEMAYDLVGRLEAAQTTIFDDNVSPRPSIPITNPGFEAFTLVDGQFTRPFFGSGPVGTAIVTPNPIPGWTLTPAHGDGGTFNPTTAQYSGQAPEGQNVAYSSFFLTGFPPPTILQVLPAVLTSNTRYTLQVEVGNRLDTPFPGYVVQLLAGGVLLAQDNSRHYRG